MAVQEIRVDDFTGEVLKADGFETVELFYGSKAYRLDLAPKSRQALADALDPFLTRQASSAPKAAPKRATSSAKPEESRKGKHKPEHITAIKDEFNITGVGRIAAKRWDEFYGKHPDKLKEHEEWVAEAA